MGIKKMLFIFLLAAVLISAVIFFIYAKTLDTSTSEQETVFENIEPILSNYEKRLNDKYPDINNWTRPPGPLKVGLQVGHWKNDELPDELAQLRGTSLGASGGGKQEWEVSLGIANKTAELLKEKGVEVDILPATVPVNYWADLFVAIHEDANSDRQISGFKASGPWHDLTGKANDFINIFYQEYAATTGLPTDPNITENMKGYYAFNWFKNEHAIHPMTVGAILETGFLTNANDRKLLINNSDLVARGIANSILKFFTTDK